tara:strand:- start:1476 stop:1661 length:186 start_codon:yes stop_codon:yes gene_type:complete
MYTSPFKMAAMALFTSNASVMLGACAAPPTLTKPMAVEKPRCGNGALTVNHPANTVGNIPE